MIRQLTGARRSEAQRDRERGDRDHGEGSDRSTDGCGAMTRTANPSFGMLRRCSSDSLATLPLSKVSERQHSCRREATLQVLDRRLSVGRRFVLGGAHRNVLKATLTQTGEGGPVAINEIRHPAVPEASQVAAFYRVTWRWRPPSRKGVVGPVAEPPHPRPDHDPLGESRGARLSRRVGAARPRSRRRRRARCHSIHRPPSRLRHTTPPLRLEVGSGSFGAQLRAPASHVELRFG